MDFVDINRAQDVNFAFYIAEVGKKFVKFDIQFNRRYIK